MLFSTGFYDKQTWLPPHSGHPFLVSLLDSLSFIYIDKFKEYKNLYISTAIILLKIITIVLFWHQYFPYDLLLNNYTSDIDT